MGKSSSNCGLRVQVWRIAKFILGNTSPILRYTQQGYLSGSSSGSDAADFNQSPYRPDARTSYTSSRVFGQLLGRLLKACHATPRCTAIRLMIGPLLRRGNLPCLMVRNVLRAGIKRWVLTSSLDPCRYRAQGVCLGSGRCVCFPDLTA